MPLGQSSGIAFGGSRCGPFGTALRRLGQTSRPDRRLYLPLPFTIAARISMSTRSRDGCRAGVDQYHVAHWEWLAGDARRLHRQVVPQQPRRPPQDDRLVMPPSRNLLRSVSALPMKSNPQSYHAEISSPGTEWSSITSSKMLTHRPALCGPHSAKSRRHVSNPSFFSTTLTMSRALPSTRPREATFTSATVTIWRGTKGHMHAMHHAMLPVVPPQ